MGRPSTVPRRLRRHGVAASARARRRVLPQNRWARLAVYLFFAIAYAAVMWFLVFPWIDRTFVNRPAL
ncbi:MAG: hypothetical protein LC663_04970 [Actinobacteria bacterium]|nr:hypothetical protein [Actinomycetota bacterium]